MPVVFLAGPTASGKTALSLELARQLNGEIISVDSSVIYHGLDIGTAKPGLHEQAGVVHHLIDIRQPWQSYSAADFCSDALSTIEVIQARGKVPILAGGTMLYFNALQHGLAELPAADAEIRAAIEADANVRGWPEIHKELARVDPVSAARIHPNDPQRVQRALEVYRIKGQSISELQAATTTRLSCPPVKLALVPDERSWLHKRIHSRFTAMLERGFLDEVRTLRADVRLHAGLPSMRSVGYRQAWHYLDDGETDKLWPDKAIAATRQLAKRQLTWLRGMPDISTLAADRLDLATQAKSALHVVEQAFRHPAL